MAAFYQFLMSQTACTVIKWWHSRCATLLNWFHRLL